MLGLPEGLINDAVKGFLVGPDLFHTKVLDLITGIVPERMLTAQVRFFVEAVLDPG